jgi:hydrogenase nickel incorporation protein HypB
MYRVSDVVLINKIDTMDYFDFDTEKAAARIRALRPDARIFPVSAKTGEGLDAFCAWILEALAEIKQA